MLSPRIRSLLKRMFAVTLASVAGIALIAYASDYAVFRYRLTANKAFGQVAVTTYDAVLQKSGKTQFLFNPPQVQTCAHSFFPRAGYLPCWYLERHTEQRTDI
jgi:hypothetical protein